MKKEDLKYYIPEYLAGMLEKNIVENIESKILQDPTFRNEFEELSKMHNLLNKVSDTKPEHETKEQFELMLNEYENTHKKTQKPLLTIIRNKIRNWEIQHVAAVFISFIVGISMNISQTGIKENNDEEQIEALSNEIENMKETMILTLMERNSASERIKGIHLLKDFEEVDHSIVESLIETLNNDPSVNVRLSTLEVLYRLSDKPYVRKALVSALKNQDKPLVQVTLIDILIALQETDSIEELKKLLESPEVEDDVKEKVNESIHILM